MDTLLPLVGFAVATSLAPGPNALMVAAAGANSNIRGALPLVAGICLGFAAIHLVVGLGLAGPFALSRGLQGALRWVGSLALLGLAWRVSRAGLPGTAPEQAPVGFLAGAAFQFVNVRSWLIALAAVPAFTVPEMSPAMGALRIAVVFLLGGVPCLLVWAAIGAAARHWLDRPGELRGFNTAMAVLLVLSVATMVF